MAEKDKFADEMLSDDELDNVAGGSVEQTSNDSRFLSFLLEGTDYYQCMPHSEKHISLDLLYEVADVKRAWSSLGIEFKHNKNGDNTYKLNGKEISQLEAYDHAMNKVGRNVLVTPVN